ncbi:MAG: pyrroline-5-carboxylate reductase [Anaerococcus sp.]
MNIGFIGCGNMAQAIMGGILKAKITENSKVYASDLYQPTLNKVKEKFGINIFKDNKDVASKSDIILLAVKPQFYSSVIEEILPLISEDTIIISIAPGKTLKDLEILFGKKVKIVRTMPNTPALVGEGMTAMCSNNNITEEDREVALKILSSFGKVEEVKEYMMDSVTAVSGSSPAYIFMMIEAMADAAVLKGMPRNQAYTFAEQAILGSAKMALELKKHPGELKDMVTSPMGTTIEALRILESKGFRSALIEAMIACADRSSEL